MKIGLISDTHNYLDPRVPEIFAGVEHILHAGDVGLSSLIVELEQIAPVTAVVGTTQVNVTHHTPYPLARNTVPTEGGVEIHWRRLPADPTHCRYLVRALRGDADVFEGDEPEELEVIPWKLSELHALLGHEEVSEGRSIAALFIAREYLAGRFRPGA